MQGEAHQSAHVGGVPAPLDEVRERYLQRATHSMGSEHSMRGADRPSPSVSSAPATATIHGNLIYPRVLVAGSPDLVCTSRPHRKRPMKRSGQPMIVSMTLAAPSLGHDW